MNGLNEDVKSKKQKKIADNHFHNIWRLFDVLPNFAFATSEAIQGYL